MDQSRQGVEAVKRVEPRHPPIIYRPDLQSGPQRALFTTITFLAWTIWIYLFMPLIGLLGWWLGFDAFARFMLAPGSLDYLVTLAAYGLVVVATALIIFGWSRYNLMRFRGADRRSAPPPISDEMICERFQIDVESLKGIRNARIMVIEVGEEGNLTGLDIREPVSPRRRT